MRTLTTLLTVSLFAASASAAEIYHGFADGNPDLTQWQTTVSERMTGVQPGIGDESRGLHRGDGSALFKSAPIANPSSGRVDVYGGFQNPDLPSGGY